MNHIRPFIGILQKAQAVGQQTQIDEGGEGSAQLSP